MKKGFLFLCCLCLAVVLVGCTKNDSLPSLPIDVDNNEVREVAWDLLSTEDQETVTHSWEEARVREGKFDVYVLENARFEKHYCYSVAFSTTLDALLGPIVMYLDISTLECIGANLRW